MWEYVFASVFGDFVTFLEPNLIILLPEIWFASPLDGSEISSKLPQLYFHPFWN